MITVCFYELKILGGKYEKLGGEGGYIVGTCIVCEAHSEHAKHVLFLGGLEHAPHRKILKTWRQF